eukprot:2405454-Rhodomonas_salina.1
MHNPTTLLPSPANARSLSSLSLFLPFLLPSPPSTPPPAHFSSLRVPSLLAQIGGGGGGGRVASSVDAALCGEGQLWGCQRQGRQPGDVCRDRRQLRRAPALARA